MTQDSPTAPYRALLARVNRFPQGAPPSELLYRILAILFRPQEAELAARLPLRPFSEATAARIWGVSPAVARSTLEALAERALLVDLEHHGETRYFLPPPMAGFFEFSLMRVRSDIDQAELARLFFQYINVEEEFVRELFAEGATKIGRVFVNEAAIAPELTTRVLGYERASEVIRGASHLAVGLCYCRRKMDLAQSACAAPLNNCLTLNQVARSLIRHGHARAIDAAQGLDLLQQARAHNLLQCGDNVQNEVSFICNCCGCCCEALLALRRLQIPRGPYSTNFVAALDAGACSGCGNCLRICPVEALSLEEGAPEEGAGGTETPGRVGKPGRRRARLDRESCLGCGICVNNCPTRALQLESRPERLVTPVNVAHRVVLMALERGKLPELIFDDASKPSHRRLGAILAAILRLPPVKRLAASRQLKSRFLDRILRDVKVTDFTG